VLPQPFGTVPHSVCKSAQVLQAGVPPSGEVPAEPPTPVLPVVAPPAPVSTVSVDVDEPADVTAGIPVSSAAEN